MASASPTSLATVLMITLQATKSESPLLYGELDEWKDLIPIAQEDEGFAPLAPILYSDECTCWSRRTHAS
jgi:hypothetical protein